MQNLRNRGTTPLMAVAILMIVGIIAGIGTLLYLPQLLQPTTQGITGVGIQPTVGGVACAIEDTTVRVSLRNAGTGGVAGANAQLRSADGTPVVGNTYVSSATQLSTAVPTNFNGNLYVGNDNYLTTTTDQGSEIYYTKKSLSFGCTGAFDVPEVKVYNESYPVWTAYDDGTIEATLNVTVDTGATVDSTELKIKVNDVDACIGNPDFNRPLAVGFNATNNNGQSNITEMRPITYDTTVPLPEWTSGRAFIGSSMYVLPINALCDIEGFNTEYRFAVRIKADAGKNPGGSPNDNYYAYLFDYTYLIDDNNKWQTGWAFNSVTGTDSDIGFDTLTYVKGIALS